MCVSSELNCFVKFSSSNISFTDMLFCLGHSTAPSSRSVFVIIVTGESKMQYLGIRALKLWRESGRKNQLRKLFLRLHVDWLSYVTSIFNPRMLN
jgi:hypothetical protein